jgi:hypothetical protein
LGGRSSRNCAFTVSRSDKSVAVTISGGAPGGMDSMRSETHCSAGDWPEPDTMAV